MSEIPKAVLSDHISDRIAGRRVVTGVFLTFELDPAFFELEVLPTLFDQGFANAKQLRRVQLEDALRTLSQPLAVFYDRNGLRIDGESAHLEWQRVPVHHTAGVFHPKNVILLVEDQEPDADGQRQQVLLLATLSANLTQSGWWENVECCDVREIAADAKTWLREPLRKLLRDLRARTRAVADVPALAAILEFLGDTEPRMRRLREELVVAMWPGDGNLIDFLDAEAGERLRGCHLEVLSPFFDESAQCKPLRDLIDQLSPASVRVLLPQSDGKAACDQRIFDDVRGLRGVEWGALPGEFLRVGRGERARERSVHAKVYRFFRQNPKEEFVLLGSPNLTNAAHANGGNWETAILVQVEPERRPDFWLQPLERPPKDFVARSEEGEQEGNLGSPLLLRYHWGAGRAEIYWDSREASPAIDVSARGIALGSLDALAARQWAEAPAEFAGRLREVLSTTSILEATPCGMRPGHVLVQEDGMAQKPSLLFQLSVSDILEYWSQLSAQQRAAFWERRWQFFRSEEGGPDCPPLEDPKRSLFDRFAGIFHAFSNLERQVREALVPKRGRRSDATCRIFGCKYDSLSQLLESAKSTPDLGDVTRYVIWLTAHQMVHELRRDHAEFFDEFRQEAAKLDEVLRYREDLRARLAAGPGAMGDFLTWFEPHFVRRAEPLEAES